MAKKKQPVLMEMDDYPISITLYDRHLGKAGIGKLPRVGEKLNISGIVVVSSVTERKSMNDGSPARSVSVDFNKIDLSKGKTSNKEMADALYGKES